MGKAVLAGRIDQQAEHQIGEFVTGRALDRPILAQRLVPSEDLLDDKVERARRMFAQTQEIALRVEQPVDMVDPQSIQHSVAQQLEREAVRVIEQLRQFHAQAGELVDVEEAPVIDVVGGNAEMRGAPVLILDQCGQLTPGL